MSITRTVHCIYCDDVREEITNKLSLIGVYQSVMFVREFPILLSKLCIVVNIHTPVSQPFEDLKVRVLLNDDVIAEIDLDQALLQSQVNLQNENQDDDNTFISFNTVFRLMPLVIPEPSFIRVRAITENKEIKGTALKVMQLPKPPEQVNSNKHTDV